MNSGHSWTNTEGDKCELCGDKDWMADKYCSGNPEVKQQRKCWLEELAKQETAAACSAS